MGMEQDTIEVRRATLRDGRMELELPTGQLLRVPVGQFAAEREFTRGHIIMGAVSSEMTTHVMLDLETLGTVPGCVGFSIGAVEFHPPTNQLGREFYCVIDVDSCLDKFLREEEATKQWWEDQSDAAKVALHHARSGEATPLPDAMTSLNEWLKTLNLGKNILLYGNGADFDNPILRVMYDAAGVKPYAGQWGGRCYRTLKNLQELFGPTFAFSAIERDGTYHNALDDAKSQALHLMANIARIKRYHALGNEGAIK